MHCRSLIFRLKINTYGMKTTFLACCFLGAAALSAQQLPHTDLLLFSLVKNTDGNWSVVAPKFLSANNPRGYNNQPCFFPSGEIYLTVQEAADTSQTDIFALDAVLKTRTQVTATAESEFSPTPMPGGRQFSVVRVEPDNRQRLWAIPIDRADAGRPVFPDIDNVGYHCWLRDTLCALYLVGNGPANPDRLVLAGTRGKKPLWIASGIGRCLLKTPDDKLAFVQKATEQTWLLKTYDLRTQHADVVVKTLPGSEDFAILPDGTYLAGSGAKLYQYKPGVQTDWKEIANLSKYGVKNITRLAYGKDNRLAIVVQ